MIRFIDLFAGIGGFHVALKAAGLKCRFACELDDDAGAAYLQNFRQLPSVDICDVAASDIPEHEVLCAGFPCQSFSGAGKGQGFDDRRGLLFYEIIRIAKHHRPPLMILENVKTILTIDGGEVLKAIHGALDEIGYRVERCLMNAADFNIPQNRERVFFVAMRKDAGLTFKPPYKHKEFKVLNDVIMPDCDALAELEVMRDDIVFEEPIERERQRSIMRVGYLGKIRQGERIYSPNGLAITLSANGGGPGRRTGLYYINGRVRRLHISEAKAVMGFSPDHIVSKGSAGYRQLGNAVVPGMVKEIYNGVAWP